MDMDMDTQTQATPTPAHAPIPTPTSTSADVVSSDPHDSGNSNYLPLSPTDDSSEMDIDSSEAGAAPVDVNHRNNSRPSSANKGRERPKSTGHTLHWFACVGQDPEFEPDDNYDDFDEEAGTAPLTLQLEPQNTLDAIRSPDSGYDREERARLVRERQQSERQRKLEELRAHALAAQRFREQKEEERRRRIDEMRHRDNDRRHQVEERKRAIWEAERERREAILKRNEEREARLESRRRPGATSAGVFAFGSSTPRMLEPADTGGTFWGHRRATSTSNVMFAALPLSRRSSERELDPNKKRAASASGLDRQQGDDFRVSSSMYEIFHWNEFGGSDAVGSRPLSIFQPSTANQGDDGGAETVPWSRVARRRTDLVPTIPAHRSDTAPPSRPTSAARSPGRAYSMTRLDQLAQPRKPLRALPPVVAPVVAPSRPPRHRSMGNLAAASHGGPSPPPRTKHVKQPSQQQPASGLRSGEVTPGSPSRPGSSLSSTSTTGAMTASVTGGLVTRRPRAAPRRPRPASIAGTGVTTPPHVKTTTVGADGKLIGLRAEKPPLPRVHSAGTSLKKQAVTTSEKPVPSEKPEVPKRTHKVGITKASPRVTPRATPLQSPSTEVASSTIQEVKETVTVESGETVVVTQNETTNIDAEGNQTIVTETTKQVTKDSNGEIAQTNVTTVTATEISNNGIQETLVETITTEEIHSNNKPVMPDVLSEGIENMKISENKEKVDNVKSQENLQINEQLENADMTSSMMAKSRITTEEEAKAALAERRRLAREEAEKQAEKERLRLLKEAEEEAERQRQEEERQRKLEEETIRLSELQRQAEEERLQQAILEAQKRAEEENAKKEIEAKARAEREAAEARAREEAERQRKETAERLQREEQEREARRKRVDAIMQRTRQAKQKKDGDKSPSEENKSIEDSEQKSSDNKTSEGEQMDLSQQNIQSIANESSYEQSVREREEHLLNHTAPHNQANLYNNTKSDNMQVQESNTYQNGTSNGGSKVEFETVQSNNYATQNGHSKNQELNNFMNNSNDNQFSNLVALDNSVKQNNLVDISEFDMLNMENSNNPFLVEVNTNGTVTNNANSNVNQIIDLSLDSIGKSAIINEDSVNSNQSVNNSPFITSFQDNQDNRDVSLL